MLQEEVGKGTWKSSERGKGSGKWFNYIISEKIKLKNKYEQ